MEGHNGKTNINKSIRQAISDDLYIYPDSLRPVGDLTFFILKGPEKRFLGVIGPSEELNAAGFTGRLSTKIDAGGGKGYAVGLYEQNEKNLDIILELIPSLKPVPLGTGTSFGFGDRLGIANAAHKRAVKKQKAPILPVLAQQSVRELLKTGKDFKKVVYNSLWSVIQEGYQGKWGADADHIKDREYFVKAEDAGMTMFTLDTSDHLDEDVIGMSPEQIRGRYDLDSGYIKTVKERYLGKEIKIGGSNISFDEDIVIRLALVYGKALDFARDIFQFLSGKLKTFDYEVSFDETGTVTSPHAQYFIASEMHENDIDFSSLALRFPGTFEKGIDYLGDIDEFEKSIKIHSQISRMIGGYKLSLHSGSDKLSIYPIFARHTQGVFHIKTSGTSWLEEVRIGAAVDPSFFKELYKIAYDTFEENKKAYHVNLDIADLPEKIDKKYENDMPGIMSLPDIRRMFHIAYGAILDQKGKRLFGILYQNESMHYDYLLENFGSHFKALKN